MKVKGIKRGKTIELIEEIAVPDGVEVSVEFPDEITETPDQWEQLKEAIGDWKDDPKITEIFAQIDQERHRELAK